MNFRDRKIAAPLKRSRSAIAVITHMDFRDRKIAAPLKLIRWRRYGGDL